jgi:hypothetical protein
MATARYIASNVSTQLMPKSMFEIIATLAEDPDGYRSDMRTKLLEIADTMPLVPMAAARERKVGAFVKETVGNLLINQRPNSSPPAQLSKTRSDGWAERQRRPSAGRETGRQGSRRSVSIAPTRNAAGRGTVCSRETG